MGTSGLRRAIAPTSSSPETWYSTQNSSRLYCRFTRRRSAHISASAAAKFGRLLNFNSLRLTDGLQPYV